MRNDKNLLKVRINSDNEDETEWNLMYKLTNASLDLLQATAIPSGTRFSPSLCFSMNLHLISCCSFNILCNFIEKLFSNRHSIIVGTHFQKYVPVTSTFLDSQCSVNHFMWLSFDRFLHYLDLNSFPLSRSTMEALADTYMAQ